MIWSCKVFSSKYPILTAYGKGKSKSLAVASAYAEFMERLQCFSPLFFKRNGSIILEPVFHDSKCITIDEVSYNCTTILKDICPSYKRHMNKYVDCLPFYDIFEGKTTYLPYNLLLYSTSSNGMCAGNTLEEALCQGISEIFERYIIRELFFGRIHSLPTLSIDALELNPDGIVRTISYLQNKDYRVIIKDCTIGGKIPVLGVAILNEKTRTFNIKFGADPFLEIALERCITELFQCRDNLPYVIDDFVDLKTDIDCPYENTQAFLSYFLSHGGRSNFKDAFVAPYLSNIDCLRKLLEQVNYFGESVYVRDFSFLGFPSYFIFITNMSKLETIDNNHFDFLFQDSDNLLESVFNSRTMSTSALERMSIKIYKHLYQRTLQPLTELRCRLMLWNNTKSFVNLRVLLSISMLKAKNFKMSCIFSEDAIPIEYPLDTITKKILNAISSFSRAALNNSELNSELSTNCKDEIIENFISYYNELFAGSIPHCMPYLNSNDFYFGFCSGKDHCKTCKYREKCYNEFYYSLYSIALNKAQLHSQNILLESMKKTMCYNINFSGTESDRSISPHNYQSI